MGTVSRRDFLKNGAVGLAAVSSLSWMSRLAVAAPKTDVPETWDYETDVIVVGSGTGLTGAISAAAAGARVMVLEKMGVPGGSTLMSGGVVWRGSPTTTSWLAKGSLIPGRTP